MLKQLMIVLIMAGANLSFSQIVLSQKVISGVVVSGQSGYLRISSTVGQVADGTLENPYGAILLTQGFHQPQETNVSNLRAENALLESSETSNSLTPEVFVHPNPATESLVYELKNASFSSPVHIAVYNALGTVVAEYELVREVSVLDVISLPAGMYRIVCSNSNVRTTSFVKNR